LGYNNILAKGDANMLEAKINKLLNEGNFDEASSLLNHYIAEAEIIDPASDESWGPCTDHIGYRILSERGIKAFCAYWEDLLSFFTKELEPKWGHLHKGHIFLRLGIGYLGINLVDAESYFLKGLEEDRLIAQGWKEKDRELDIEEAVMNSPAYVTLCIAEILSKWPFANEAEKKTFFEALVPLHFDVIWGPKEADKDRVIRAIRYIVRKKCIESVLQVKNELDTMFSLRLTFSTLSAIETFLKVFLYNVMYEKPVSELMQEKEGFKGSLGELIYEADHKNIFPLSTIKVTWHMAHILIRILPFITDKDNKHAFTSKVIKQITVAMKILLDMALIEWSDLVQRK
jgi:hypothetical protein